MLTGGGTTSSASSGGTGAACLAEILEETAGPYPADGSVGGPGDGDPAGTPPGPADGAPPSGGTPPGEPPVSAMQSGDAVNVLTRSGIVRSDLRTSLATGNTALGVPATINLQLVNSAGACEPLAGYAVYLWGCTREGIALLGKRACRGLSARRIGDRRRRDGGVHNGFPGLLRGAVAARALRDLRVA